MTLLEAIAILGTEGPDSVQEDIWHSGPWPLESL